MNIELFEEEKTLRNTNEECEDTSDCKLSGDMCIEFNGNPKRCVNNREMTHICGLQNKELKKKNGVNICKTPPFPRYNPNHKYDSASTINYKRYCEEGQSKDFCVTNKEFANNCIEECGYPEYNDLVDYSKNENNVDNHKSFCENGEKKGKCNLPSFATACVEECGYPEYNALLQYPIVDEMNHQNNFLNYCESGKRREECTKTSIFADACQSICGYPGYNDKVTYPVMNETTDNYSNYCSSGKLKGLCTDSKFSFGCRPECKQ